MLIKTDSSSAFGPFCFQPLLKTSLQNATSIPSILSTQLYKIFESRPSDEARCHFLLKTATEKATAFESELRSTIWSQWAVERRRV